MEHYNFGAFEANAALVLQSTSFRVSERLVLQGVVEWFSHKFWRSLTSGSLGFLMMMRFFWALGLLPYVPEKAGGDPKLPDQYRLFTFHIYNPPLFFNKKKEKKSRNH